MEKWHDVVELFVKTTACCKCSLKKTRYNSYYNYARNIVFLHILQMFKWNNVLEDNVSPWNIKLYIGKHVMIKLTPAKLWSTQPE